MIPIRSRVASYRRLGQVSYSAVTRGCVRGALILLAVAVVMLSNTTHAGLLVTIEEYGSNVTATLSGAFATLPTPQSSVFEQTFSNRLNADSPYFDVTTTGSTVNVLEYGFSSSLPAFGTGNQNYDASSGTANGDFSVRGSKLRLATSYTLGTSFSGVLIWANESFASIGLTPGTYATTLSGGDAGATVTVNVVPEPSSLAMLAVGLACGSVGLLRRRGVRGPDGCRGKARLVRSEG